MKKQLLTFILSLSVLSLFSQTANQPNDLVLCDDDNDGFVFFDLTSVEAQVLGSQNGVDYLISFHETQVDVDNGSNAIISPSSYSNSAPNLQTIYVRLEEVATGNYATTSFDIIVNPLPSILPVTSYELCDFDNTGDEQEQFDLTIKDSEILNGQTNISVAYYQTLVDADTNTNAITGLYTNISNPQEIYAVLTNTITNCYSMVNFTLVVNAEPVANTPTPLEICDDDTPDGLTSIDLSSKSAEITGNNPSYALSYYLDQADADNNVSPLPTIYTNISNPQTIIARVLDINTGCFATTSLELVVEQAPIAFTPTALRYCDPDNDGFGVFMLTNADNEITGGSTDLMVSYYETYADAFNNVNTIDVTVGYNNIVVNMQTLYARVESATIATNCTTIVELELIVEPTPQLLDPTPLEACDDISADDFVAFDLTSKAAEVLNGQDPTQYIVSYYETESNANTSNNPIANPLAYTNTEPNYQIIWIRVEDSNTVEGCYKITSLELIVNPLPVLVAPSTLELCDVNNPGDEQEAFYLEDANAEILNGQTGITLTYYETLIDAETATNPIMSPYTNTSNAQTIFVRAENDITGCYSTITLILRVDSLPVFNIDDISFCVGETVTIDTGLSASNYNFEWSYNASVIPNETQPLLIATQSGSYSVIVTDLISGCSISKSFEVSEIICVDTDSDGVIDSDEDLNENGNLEDDDTDDDGTPNYLDNDDDGDNVDTIIEINVVLGRNAIHPFVDTDNDLIENYLDDDDDGDNVLTIDEDYNNNGDPTDDDTNTNNIPDYLESIVALSLGEFSITNFSVYPNPAKDKVAIQLNTNFNEDLELRIYDIRGKQMDVSTAINTLVTEIDISELSSGLYFIQLSNASTVLVEKLVVD